MEWMKTRGNYVRRYDEYYTTKEHVEYIFKNYLNQISLKGKIIYSPCDSEKSEFVKYIKAHKDELQYKEYIYTSDDYNTHLDLFDYCDIVITNPPFSKIIKEFIPILNNCKKEFFILGSLINIWCYYDHFGDKENIKFERPAKMFPFNCPDPNLSNTPLYIYMYNIQCIKSPKNKLILGPDKGKEIYLYGIKNYDKLRWIPEDIDEEILVPSTVLLEQNRYLFDIIKNGIRDKTTGKYIRILVKKKKKSSL